MAQPSHDPYKCFECLQTFDPQVPSSHPRILECKHCLCTECLREIICDLTRLTYSSIRPTSASNLTCKLCGHKTLVYSNKLDLFRVDDKILKKMETFNQAQPGCQHRYMEKFCNICIMNFCSACMITHNQMHRANAMENKLEGLYRKLNHDLHDLRFETFTGKKRIGEHYQRVLQRLQSEYHSTLDMFSQKSSRIENRLHHHSNTILTQKDRLNQQQKSSDGKNPSALGRSILESETLINGLQQLSNRAELENLKSITSGFEHLDFHKKSQSIPLPSIFSAGESFSNTEELSNTFSELNIHIPDESIYGHRPSTVDYAAQRIPTSPPVSKQYLQHGQSIFPAINLPRQAARSSHMSFRPISPQRPPPPPNGANLYARTLTPQHMPPLHRPNHFKNL